ncbi:MAG TPA: tetratricopeptide repeat protein, partial [Kiritimatiellia bacterium]|nr:tetratricopeptide repeat protein [Kiritimatiellia bacterium]
MARQRELKQKASPRAPAPAARKWMPPAWMAALALGLAVAAVYRGTLNVSFLMDDGYNIVENPAIRRLWPPSAVLNPPTVEMTFYSRPFINLTMCVDYALSGLDPRGYHRTNLLFHLAAVLALFGLVRRALRRAGVEEPAARGLGFAAALLWAVHPLTTAAVNYLSQRGELGVGLFLFLLLYGLDRAAGDPADPTAPSPRVARAWLAAAVFSCLLGMGSKESMAAAPLLAMTYDRIFLATSWKEMFRRRGLFYLALALTLLWPISRHFPVSSHIPKGGFTPDTFWRYPLTQAWGLARLLGLSVWPAALVFDYGEGLVRGPAEVWPQLLLIFALLALTGWALRRHPRAGFAALCFWALLAPSSSFFPVTGQPVAEHRMYAPLAALVALAATGLWRLARRHERGRLFAVAVLVLALALGAAGYRRTALHASRVALWQDTVAKRPGSERGWNSLGQALQDERRFGDALAAYEKAIAIKPTALGYVNAGVALHSMGRYEDAARYARQALELDPSSELAESRLGIALASLGRHEEAIAAERRALELKPDSAIAHLYLAKSLAGLQRYDEALPHYREAIRFQPDQLEPYAGLAVALFRAGRPGEARQVMRDVVRASRVPGLVYFELSRRLIEEGLEGDGLEMARRHLDLEPGHIGSLNNAAWLLATSTNAALRNGAEAVRFARRAVEQSAQPHPALLATLAAAQAEAGQFPEAVATTGRALDLARERGDTN